MFYCIVFVSMNHTGPKLWARDAGGGGGLNKVFTNSVQIFCSMQFYLALYMFLRTVILVLSKQILSVYVCVRMM
jgi:hypothetical protein